MHGKLLLIHSRSTVFLAKRLNIRLLLRLRGETAPGPTPSLCLLGKCEFDLARTRDVDWLGLSLHAFVPGHDVVFAIRDVLDLKVSAGIGLSEVRPD
jgi:hypothetical protein